MNMPHPIYDYGRSDCAHTNYQASPGLTKVRKDGTLRYLRPDGKTQVKNKDITFCGSEDGREPCWRRNVWMAAGRMHLVPYLKCRKPKALVGEYKIRRYIRPMLC